MSKQGVHAGPVAMEEGEHALNQSCPFQAAFLAAQHEDMMDDVSQLTSVLTTLADMLREFNETPGWPVWLQAGLPCAFLRNELMFQGSPQDFLRRLWQRRRPAAFKLEAAFKAVADVLTGEPDPWAFAVPPPLTYCIPRCNGSPLELHISEADYLTSGPGRFVCGAAMVLSRRVLDDETCPNVCGQRVLELGCGVGLVGLACAAAGASFVTLTDFAPTVLTACQRNIHCNAAANGGALHHAVASRMRTVRLDWAAARDALPDMLFDSEFVPFDVVVAADVCYDPNHPAQLLGALHVLGRCGLLADGAKVWILNGWPNRGLQRFEQLIGALALQAGRAFAPAPDVLSAPHERKFLQAAEERDRELEVDAAFATIAGELRFLNVQDILDGQDERGAQAIMRLYCLTWCPEAGGIDLGQRMIARAICLRRCVERWTACESHMQEVLPSWMDFQMAEGKDGSLFKDCLRSDVATSMDEAEPLPTEEQIAAVESNMGCKLYRGWPVCETFDVLRVLACEDSDDIDTLSEAQAWERYRMWFSDWPRHRSWPYIDFHCRHITLGEVGAALSHLRLIDEALVKGVCMAIFFEDDARPREHAVRRLVEEVAVLDEHGFAWDLIYLRASLYSKLPEDPLSSEVPGSRLFRARHRKVTDAYCLSRRGMERISRSGFRECLFAFDDFLPALHSEHPRKDVMALECVANARCDAEGGFVGLSFGEEVLCETARTASETNLSPCILGDHGTELC